MRQRALVVLVTMVCTVAAKLVWGKTKGVHYDLPHSRGMKCAVCISSRWLQGTSVIFIQMAGIVRGSL